jgi:hypothetical protein
MRSNLVSFAIAVALLAAQPAHAAGQDAGVSQSELDALRAQIAALQARVDAMQAANDAGVAATTGKAGKPEVPVGDTNTSFSGKMFFDLTSLDQDVDGTKTNASGVGLDVKRFYLTVNHGFNDVWSANLTTDFQYVSGLDSAANVYVKKAYVQGKFSDAFTVRVGSADMPWIPFAESFYGFRYVENTLVDRLKYGASSDWGVHAGGNLGGKAFNYAASVVNGAGYKNPSRGKGMDVEARFGFVPVAGMVVAVGGYSGTLGKEKQNIDALHTASRTDAMVAYLGSHFRLGGEYFRANDWGNVLTAASDSADGWSLWGSVGLGAGGATAFARYDRADLSNDLDPSLQDTYYNVGVEFPVTKGFKLAAVYKDDSKESDASTTTTREVGVWGEVAF